MIWSDVRRSCQPGQGRYSISVDFSDLVAGGHVLLPSSNSGFSTVCRGIAGNQH